MLIKETVNYINKDEITNLLLKGVSLAAKQNGIVAIYKDDIIHLIYHYLKNDNHFINQYELYSLEFDARNYPKDGGEENTISFDLVFHETPYKDVNGNFILIRRKEYINIILSEASAEHIKEYERNCQEEHHPFYFISDSNTTEQLLDIRCSYNRDGILGKVRVFNFIKFIYYYIPNIPSKNEIILDLLSNQI